MTTTEGSRTPIRIGGARTAPGFTASARPGDRVSANEPICVLHARTHVGCEAVAARQRREVELADTRTAPAGRIAQEPLGGVPA